jgi:hypothetical protein
MSGIRLRKRRRCPINNNRGVITLEATLIIPLFLTLVIGLLLLIRIAFVQITLQNAADEVVKQFSALAYPLEPAIEQAVSTKDGWVHSLLELVPLTMKPTIEQFINDQWNDKLTQPTMNLMFKPVYWHYLNSNYKQTFIRYDQLHIERVSFPGVNNTDGWFGIEVRYEFAISLPFYQKTIVLRKRAYERAWLGI